MNRQLYKAGRTVHSKKVPSYSYWTDSVSHREYSALNSNITTEVAIIGGGMSGLSVAQALAKQGKNCVVLETGLIGGGETRHSSAHLTLALDVRYYTLKKIYGEMCTKLIAQSHTAAIHQIEKTVRSEGIDCDFQRVDGYLFLHPSDNIKSLQRELEATREAGIGTEMVPSAPVIQLKEKIALKFPEQAQFHPIKYLHGLCGSVINHNGKIFTNTKVTSINKKSVDTEHYRVSADHIVVATNRPFDNTFTVLMKQTTYRSYIIALMVEHDTVAPALWWDTGKQDGYDITAPYYYARVQRHDEKFDLLLCGGQDHEMYTDWVDDSTQFENLEAWARKHFPMAKDLAYRWSGLISEPQDILGYIGLYPGHENCYVVTGDAGNGLNYGAIAGNLIADLIFSRENPWANIYSPLRPPVTVPEEFSKRKRNLASRKKTVDKGNIWTPKQFRKFER